MKVDKLVPEIYYKESRDFSYIGRVFEVLFNYLKTNADLVGANPLNNEVPSSIITLLASTLGFESKHEYMTKDLVALCSAFVYLYKNKGTQNAIEDSIRILLRTQGIEDGFNVIPDENDKYHYYLYVPPELKDSVILEDLFEYILPAGITYTFRYGVSKDRKSTYKTEVVTSDSVSRYIMNGNGEQLAQVSNSGDNSTLGITTNIDETNYTNRSMTYTGVVPGGHEVATQSNNEEEEE